MKKKNDCKKEIFSVKYVLSWQKKEQEKLWGLSVVSVKDKITPQNEIK